MTFRRIKWRTIVLVILAILVVWTVTSLILGLGTGPEETGIIHKPAT